jgi:hypothetical protein
VLYSSFLNTVELAFQALGWLLYGLVAQKFLGYIALIHHSRTLHTNFDCPLLASSHFTGGTRVPTLQGSTPSF